MSPQGDIHTWYVCLSLPRYHGSVVLDAVSNCPVHIVDLDPSYIFDNNTFYHNRGAILAAGTI